MFQYLNQFKRNKPMRVVVNGHPALRNTSTPITEITPAVREFAADLTRALVEGETPGVGLAAPQVGVNCRMIVVDTALKGNTSRQGALPGELLLDPQMPVVLINPEIISVSEEVECASEGCLSLPGVNGHVTRPTEVVLTATLLNGESITAQCGGLLARCLQHEIDHLNGVLFYDRIPAEEQKKAEGQMKQLARREASLVALEKKNSQGARK